MSLCYVGFDTSNYTTSAAVCDDGGEILANFKMPLPVKEGERGLRQSDALFAHIRHLPDLCEKLRTVIGGHTVAAIGCSTRPRNAEDSYMPVFLAGKSAAYACGAVANAPVYSFSHQDGHIMAALYRCGRREELLGRDFFAFHVSGGTTEGLAVTPVSEGFRIEKLAGTGDIHAGQAIDRVGVAMGLKFPCGKAMEELAQSFDGRILRHSVCVKNGVCSLSGVENLALSLYRETGDRRAVAAFVFDFIERTVIAMGEEMMAKRGTKPMLFAGGVMSNHLMRKHLGETFDACFAEPEFSADNAAGIALLCRRKALECEHGSKS